MIILAVHFLTLVILSNESPTLPSLTQNIRMVNGTHPCRESPTGFKLVDNITCAEGTKRMLLIIQKSKISGISLDSPDNINIVLPLAGIKYATAIDIDPVQEMLYWTDVKASAIRRASLDGSIQEDILNEVKTSKGIAVDWLARNLYWTVTEKGQIEVARLNGTNRKVLINEDLIDPTAITIAPELGWMFWADWNKKGQKIERSNLDGTERIVLVSKNIIWPNGLTLDVAKQKIYWVDTWMRTIEVCNMDGTDRETVITDNLRYPYSLSLLDDYLYWTDWQRQTIDRAHKVTGGKNNVIIHQVPNVIGVKAVHFGKVNSTNPCTENNGGCNHLCLNRPQNKYVCVCQTEFELMEDKKTCVIPNALILFSRKYYALCSVVAKNCIPTTRKCNSQIDCHVDGNNELDCPACTRNQIMCPSGHCIDMALAWNGTDQCPDGVHEAYCCGPNQFWCTRDGACIADSSDERAACIHANNPQDDLSEQQKTIIFLSWVLIGLALIVTGFIFNGCTKIIKNARLPDSAEDPSPLERTKLGTPMFAQRNCTKDLLNDKWPIYEEVDFTN